MSIPARFVERSPQGSSRPPAGLDRTARRERESRPSAVGEAVRLAKVADIASLHALIRHYSQQGILLPRTKRDLRKSIHDFRVITSYDRVLACAILHLYTPRIAELRSLAVAPDAHGAGLGRRIVEALIEEARSRSLDMVFAFTYEATFFARMGFLPIDRALVPWKAWKDCIHCPKQDCCDEIAVARWLQAPPPALPVPLFPILSGHNGLWQS